MVILTKPITAKDFINLKRITTVEQENDHRIIKIYRFKDFYSRIYKNITPLGIRYEITEIDESFSTSRWSGSHVTFKKTGFPLQEINRIITKSIGMTEFDYLKNAPYTTIYLAMTDLPNDDSLEDIFYDFIYRNESLEGYNTHRKSSRKTTCKQFVCPEKMF